ncbi:alpha/beta hydrolase [Chishuiella sp.]|uniref:alpha/beta hydrolase n=1 Tax=Chishuiella sp. TaxID=1969467 RepID=UPI0028B00887|nr:dienelactone hydrolase family protein [Chishuiella sp.]
MRVTGLLSSICICLLFICCNGKNKKVETIEKNIIEENSVVENDSLNYLIRDAKGSEKPILLILMHGFGANEEDLFPIAASLPENYIVVTPQAPYKIGNDNYQWYKNEKDKNGNFSGRKEDLDNSIHKIEDLIKYLQNEYKIKSDRTFIGGFSQGANMSYLIGLENPKLVKGIAILSGTIFSRIKNDKKLDKSSGLKIFIGHGDQDNRIPYSEAETAKKWLEENKYSVDFHTYKGISHSISEQEINDLAEFIHKNLE